MKALCPALTLLLVVLGCKDVKQAEKPSLAQADTVQNVTLPVTEKKQPVAAGMVFPYLSGYPKIKDSLAFINKLREVAGLVVHESPVQAAKQKITAFKRIKLYGADKDFYLVEYNWAAGSMAGYPWQYQVVFTAEGRPLKVIAGERFELVTIFPKQNPFLLATIVTSRGNGGHRIYKVAADSLENIYEGYYNYDVRTVCTGHDTYAFAPEELNVSFKDHNKDGYNDIIFSGQKLLLYATTPDGLKYDTRTVNGKSKPFTPYDPAKRIPVTYIFLYDKASGHFKAKEPYDVKD